MYAYMFNVTYDNETEDQIVVHAEIAADAWARIYDRYLRTSDGSTLESAAIIGVMPI